MRRTVLVVAAVLVLLALLPLGVSADTPSPSPSSGTSPDPTTSTTTTTSPSTTTSATTTSPTPVSGTVDPSPLGTTSPAPVTTSPTPTPTDSGPTPAATPAGSGSTPNATSAPGPGPTTSPTADPATERLIEQARQQLGSGIGDGLAAVQQLSDTLNENSREQNDIQNRIQACQARIDGLNREMDRLDAEVQTTQDRIAGERVEIGVLARTLYQEPDSLLLRLLRAGSVREMVTQTSDLTEAALHAEALKRQLSDDLDRVRADQQQRQQARAEEAQTAVQLAQALSQLHDLSVAEQQTSDRLQSLIHDGQAALQSIGRSDLSLVQQVATMLQQRQQSLIAEAENQVWRQEQLWATLNRLTLPPVSVETSANLSGYRFIWPVHGASLTQGFGPSSLWLEPSMFGFPHFHTGLDLASPNTTIAAAADGVVAVVGSGTTGYGNYVVIVHRDGFVTLYGHLSLALVHVGDVVTQGQQIGVEGSTGASTGVHLHFEARLNGTPVDPSPYLPPAGAA